MNFWAWTDILGWNFFRHLGYFWPDYQHPFWYCGTLRRITKFILCSQSPLNLHHFCLTRFQIKGWLELIGTPSVDILHRSDCAWLCCLLSQCFSIIQPLVLQKTKPLYPTPKYLFGSEIWIWAAKNLRLSIRVSVVRG